MKKTVSKSQLTTPINETMLFNQISKIIEKRKNRAGMYANREVTLMYWDDENEPIGIILCTKASRNQIDRITKHE